MCDVKVMLAERFFPLARRAKRLHEIHLVYRVLAVVTALNDLSEQIGKDRLPYDASAITLYSSEE